MTYFYADASAIVATYLDDQEDHAALRETLHGGTDPVMVSEIVRVEVASAAMAAQRARRIADGREVVARFTAHCLPGGPFIPVAFDLPAVLPRALELMEEHPLAALEALHLAVAIIHGQPLAAGEELVFVTRDRRQAAAARAVGFTVA